MLPVATRSLTEDIREILIAEDQVQAKVRELGAQISRDYAGRDLTLVCVLRGAVVFLADLIRHITVPHAVDFVAIASYGIHTRSSGVVRILKDLDDSVESKYVLIVEDIVDTGLTLNYLVEMLRGRNAASVRVVSFLDKPSRRKIDIRPDYVGFEVPDEFVVGYGLDYAQQYRNLPFVGVLKPEIYGGRETPPDEPEA